MYYLIRKIVFLLVVVALLLQSAPVFAESDDTKSQSWVDTQEAMRDLTVAPLPLSEGDMVASSDQQDAQVNTQNEECFWATGGNNPLDEQGFPPNNGNWYIKNLHLSEEVGPYSGIAEYLAYSTAQDSGTRMARIDSVGQVPNNDISRAYVYGAYRVLKPTITPATPDKLYFRVKKGDTLVVDFTEIATSNITDRNWRTWSYTLPGGATSWRNQKITLELWAETRYQNSSSTVFIVDYSGAAYCNPLPDINVSYPMILDPAPINQLYAGLLNRQSSTLWFHVSSGGLVYQGEFKSIELMYQNDEFYKAAFRMKPPLDRQFNFLQEANKLWFSQVAEQSEPQLKNIINTRLPTNENLMKAITHWRELAERQEAAGNAVRHAQASRWMQAEMQRRLDYMNSLTDLQRRVTMTPVTYVVELSASELSIKSTARQQWAGAYSLSGRSGFQIVRGIEVPADTTDDVVTEIWRQAVINDAPRNIRIVRGAEVVRISYWEQFKVGLRYNLPALISSAYNNAVITFYLYRGYTLAALEKGGEFVPWVAGAAATIGFGDAAWDLYTYQGLGKEQTSQTLTDYVLTQNVFYRILAEQGLVSYSEQVIGKNWSNVQFCFPEHELWYHRYPDLQLKTKVVPAVCGSGSYMEWKILSVNDDRLVLKKNVGATVELELSKELGSARYTIYLDDPEVGLIAQTFIIQLVQYDPAKEEGRFHIFWLSTETPEQQGLCAGASPTRPMTQPCARGSNRNYLPLITR